MCHIEIETKGFVFYGVTFDLCKFCTFLNSAQLAGWAKVRNVQNLHKPFLKRFLLVFWPILVGLYEDLGEKYEGFKNDLLNCGKKPTVDVSKFNVYKKFFTPLC